MAALAALTLLSLSLKGSASQMGGRAAFLTGHAAAAPAFGQACDAALGAGERTALSGGGWRFATDPGDVGEAQGWYAPSASDDHWHAVEVPHNWGVMDPYREFEGVAWYRRAFVGVRACLSDDGGRTWDVAGEKVLRDDGRHVDLGYPSSVQLRDGHILTTYYIHGADGIRYIGGTIYGEDETW